MCPKGSEGREDTTNKINKGVFFFLILKIAYKRAFWIKKFQACKSGFFCVGLIILNCTIKTRMDGGWAGHRWWSIF